jgi:hypothetical protein
MNKTVLKFSIVWALALILSAQTFSQIRLPGIISEGMILKRGEKVKIWGWASSGEKVTVKFMKKNTALLQTITAIGIWKWDQWMPGDLMI